MDSNVEEENLKLKKTSILALVGLALVLGLGLLLFQFPSSSSKPEIIVSAAVSLKDICLEMGDLFQKKHPHLKIHFNFGSSGSLKNQIEQGAPVSLFIAASPDPLNLLEKKNLLKEGTRKIFATNDLVLVSPKISQTFQTSGTEFSLSDLQRKKIQGLALGNPESVPLGQYAQAYLQEQKLWESLKPKMIFGENAQQVLRYLVKGDVDVGFVYATDYQREKTHLRLLTLPPHPLLKTSYPMALIKNGPWEKESMIFWNFAQSLEVKNLLTKKGFGHE